MKNTLVALGALLLLTSLATAFSQSNSFFSVTVPDSQLTVQALGRSDPLTFNVCNLQSGARQLNITIASAASTLVSRMGAFGAYSVTYPVGSCSTTANGTETNCTSTNVTTVLNGYLTLNRTTLGPAATAHGQSSQAPSACRDFQLVFWPPFNSAGKYNLTVSDQFGNALIVDPWWNTAWTYKAYRNYTTSSILGAAIANFPTLINQSTTTLVTNGKLLGNCTDYRFVNGTENAAWTFDGEMNGTCNTANTVWWVNRTWIPTNNNASNYDYYGNNASASATDPGNVWDNGYALVMHFDRYQTNYAVNDSSTSANNCTLSSASIGVNASGVFGNFLNMSPEGTGGGRCVFGSPIITQNNGMFEVLVRRQGAWVAGQRIIGDSSGFAYIEAAAADTLRCDVAAGGLKRVTSAALALNQWYHVICSWDSSNQNMYVDGQRIGSNAASGLDAGFGNLRLGAPSGAQNPAAAAIDEVRVHVGVNRSADWINASYATFKGIFNNTWGSEQTNDAVPAITLNAPVNNANLSNSTAAGILFYFTPSDDFAVTNASLYTNASGAWAYNSSNTTAMTNGGVYTHNVTGWADNTYVLWQVSVTDNATTPQTTWSANRTFWVDRTSPNPTNLAPANLSTASVNYFYVEVNMTAQGSPLNGGAVRVELGNATAANSTNYTMTCASYGCYRNFTGVNDGNYTLRVFLQDGAGNAAYTNSSNNHTVYVDVGSAPQLSGQTPANGTTVARASSQTFTYTFNAGNGTQLGWYTFFSNFTGGNQITNDTPVQFAAGVSTNTTSVTKTMNSTDGTYVWGFYVNDTSGSTNSTGNTTIVVQAASAPVGGGGGGGGSATATPSPSENATNATTFTLPNFPTGLTALPGPVDAWLRGYDLKACTNTNPASGLCTDAHSFPVPNVFLALMSTLVVIRIDSYKNKRRIAARIAQGELPASYGPEGSPGIWSAGSAAVFIILLVFYWKPLFGLGG